MKFLIKNSLFMFSHIIIGLYKHFWPKNRPKTKLFNCKFLLKIYI